MPIAVLLATVLLIPALLTSCERDKHLTLEQKLEDFRYLMQIFKDNHPYLVSDDPATYNWLSHESDFEDIIRLTQDDEQFAQALNEILLSLSNSHTLIMEERWYDTLVMCPTELTPWRDEMGRTSWDTVTKWSDMAEKPVGHPEGHTLPFRACYNQGEYLVYWMSDSFESDVGMGPGCIIDSVNGVQVHRFVAGLRGQAHLFYDPHRERFYLPEFDIPYKEGAYEVSVSDHTGSVGKTQAAFGLFESDLPPLSWPSPKEAPMRFNNMLKGNRIAYSFLPDVGSKHEDGHLLSLWEQIQDYPALIIDIRGSRGVYDTYWIRNIVQPLTPAPVTGTMGAVPRTGSYLQPFLEAYDSWFSDTAESLLGDDGEPSVHITKLAAPEELAEGLPPRLLGEGFESPSFTEITIHPTGDTPFGGRIYVLTGPTTSEAAERFAAFCKTSGWATVIGECTQGSSGTGLPAVVTLPNSRIPVIFPKDAGIYGAESYVIPHVLVEQDPKDIIDFINMEGFPLVNVQSDTVLKVCLDIALGDL